MKSEQVLVIGYAVTIFERLRFNNFELEADLDRVLLTRLYELLSSSPPSPARLAVACRLSYP